MANWNLTTIRPKGFLHSSAFAEVKDSLAWALTALGHQVNLTENAFSSGEATNIVFGCELLSPDKVLPQGSIIYNFEQPSHPNIMNVGVIAHNSGCTIWDFSKRNFERWQSYPVPTIHVPVGYTPNLTRIPKAPTQDIDVCFLGWLTPRRLKIIEDLKASKLNVFYSDKCYGGARDNILSRSKVCLNVHHDGRDMFEIVRCSYYWANRKCVVTEQSSDCDFGWTYEELVRECKTAVHNDGDRKAAEKWAYEYFIEQDYVSTVALAIEGQPVTPIQKQLSNLLGGAEGVNHKQIRERYERGLREGDMVDFLPWIRANAKGNCLEIGVRDGASTSAFLLGLEKNGGHLTSFDTEDCGKIWTHPQWTFNRQNSLQISFPDATFDVALIDGDHSRDAMRGDLYNCYYWVKPGGIILVHDIVPERGHEFYAINLREEFFRFAKEKNLKYEELPGKYGMGVLYR